MMQARGILPTGVVAPNLTPFNNDLSIAEDLYIAHAKHLLANGCVGLAPFGTTGEALSVGIDERISVLEKMIDAGVDASKLIPGTGLTNVADTARLSRACVELGCQAVMTLPPFYIKSVPDQGIIDYFIRLIETVNHPDLKIYLYHIPQVAGVGIPVNVVKDLHQQFPDIVIGIKDSSGDWDNTRALLAIDSLVVYPGSELPLIDALELGANGCISATANLNSAAIKKTIDHYANNEIANAKTNHETVKDFRLTVQSYDFIAAQKQVLAIKSNDSRWTNVRPPLIKATKDKGIELENKLSKFT